MKFDNRKLIIIILITAGILAAFLGWRYLNSTVSGLRIISSAEMDDMCRGLKCYDSGQINSPVSCGGALLPYDSQTNTLYVSQKSPAGRFEGKLIPAYPDTQVYLIEDEYIKDKADAVRDGHMFSLLTVSGDYYAVYNLVFSSMPLINISTASAGGDKDQTLIDVWDPANGRSSLLGFSSRATFKSSADGDTITVTLKGSDGIVNQKSSFLGLSDSKSWKMYAVGINDYSYMRSLLAYDLWNRMTSRSELKRDFGFAELICDNEYRGAFVILPKPGSKSGLFPVGTRIDHIEDADASDLDDIYSSDNICEYMIYAQLTGSELAFEDLYVVNEPDNDYLMPAKMEYAFGRYSDRYRYHEWNTPKVLTPFEMGVYDPETGSEYEAKAASVWKDLRSRIITYEDFDREIHRLQEMIAQSGYVSREGRTAEEYDESIAVLTGYFDTKIEAMDLYYGLEEDESFTEVFFDEVDDWCYYPVDLMIENGTDEDHIKLCIKDQTAYYMLPACADSCNIRWNFDDSRTIVKLDGQEISSGEKFDAGGSDSEHNIEISGNFNDAAVTRQYPLVIMKSENLPAIFIDTYSETNEYINRSKDNSEPGEMSVYLSDGRSDHHGYISSIKARGRSSFALPVKKSYHIRLGTGASVLGLGDRTDYLLISNVFDISKIRNALAYDLAEGLGFEAVIRYEYADVYFNGEYTGNYIITTSPTDSALEAAEKGSHGRTCIFSSEFPEEGDICFADQLGRNYTLRYPKEVTEEYVNDLGEWLNEIEDMILNCDTQEEYNELKKYVDTDSFARMYIMDRMTDEVDENYYSMYYYIDDRTGRLKTGPAWDYDRAWGNEDRAKVVCIDAYSQGLQGIMSEIPWFANEVRDIAEANEGLLTDIVKRADELSSKISSSIQMEAVTAIDKTTGFTEDPATETKLIKEFYSERKDLVLDTIYNPEDYHKVYVRDRYNGEVLWVQNGQSISDEMMDGLMEIYECDHYYTQSGEEFGAGYVVDDDILIYPDFWLDPEYDRTEWYH